MYNNLYLFILNSRQFGFINWNNSENYILRDLVRRAITALQSIISLSESNNYETLCTSGIEVKSSTLSIKTEDYEAIPPIFEFPDINNINVKDEEKLKIDTSYEFNHRVDLETYCKVGHLHLILEEYNEGNKDKLLQYKFLTFFDFAALSAYQKYFRMKPTNLNNLEILYGLGLVYFHFNAFRW